MTKERRHELLTMAALCMSCFGTISNSVFVPASADILAEFAGASDALVNFVMTGNYFVSVPFALIAAWAAQYVSKKKLLVGALIMFFAGGFGAAFANSMEFMAVARALDAASDGVITTISGSLIAEVFLDEKRRSQAMGWRQAISSIMGIVIGVFAGILALQNWRHSFYLNAFGIVCVVLAVFFVPTTPPEGKREGKRVGLRALVDNARSTRLIILEMFLFMLSQIVLYQVIYLLGTVVEELGLGTSAVTGLLVSIINAALVAACVLFSPVYMKTKVKMVAPAFLVVGVCMALISRAAGSPILFAVLVVGATFASGLMYPYYSMVVAEEAPEELMSFWMSIYTVVTYFSSSASGYLPGLVTSITGITGVAPTFVVTGGLLVVVAVIEFFRHRKAEA